MTEPDTAAQRDVTFTTANGTVLRGRLRLPGGDGPHPLVILGHGLGGLKEWPNLPDVAEALVGEGIAALAFDYRNWGDSDGQPREEIDHCGRIEDWQSAISYATSLEEADRERIGIWGTSLGGRDVLVVAGIDRRVRCVLSQVPLIQWSPQFAAWLGGYGGDLERYYQELADDRRERALGKEPRYISFESPSDDDYGAAEHQATWGDAELRNYKARITLQSYQPTALLDMTPFMPLISPAPLRMIIADEDPLPGQREAFEAALEPKSLLEFKGHHYSCYTTNKDAAVAAAREWFTQHLTSH
jgi:dienelactone hydrolase